MYSVSRVTEKAVEPAGAVAMFEPPAKMQACPSVSSATYALALPRVGLLVSSTVCRWFSGIVFILALMVDVKLSIQFAYSVALSSLLKM